MEWRRLRALRNHAGGAGGRRLTRTGRTSACLLLSLLSLLFAYLAASRIWAHFVVVLATKHPKSMYRLSAEPVEWAITQEEELHCEASLGAVDTNAAGGSGDSDVLGHCWGRATASTILTVYTHTGAIGKRVRRQLRANRLRYADAHGYRYCELGAVPDITRHAAWAKVRLGGEAGIFLVQTW